MNCHRVKKINFKIIGFYFGLLVFFSILFLPQPPGLTFNGQVTLAVFLLMGVWWATEALPLPITSLLPLILFPIFSVEEIGVISKEFMNKVQFLFAGGFMIAIAMQKWNFHKRIALSILQYTGIKARGITAGFMITSALLSMWVMNTSTTIMLLPIGLSVVLAVTESLKKISQKEKSNFQIVILLGIAYSSSVGGIATPIGTAPNGYLIQFIAEKGTDIGFFDWMLIGLPITLVLIPFIWFLLTFVLYPIDFEVPKDTKKNLRNMLKELGKISYEEKVIGIVFLVTALLWISRKVLIQIPIFSFLDDAVIAMLAGLSLFVLRSKNTSKSLLEWQDMEKQFPWGLLFLFGGGMALAYMVSSSGLASWLAGLIPTDTSVFMILFSVVLMVVFLTELTSNLATTMTFIPIVYSIGLNIGIDPLILTIPLTIAASCAFMLPVATPPNSIVYASNKIPISEMVKTGIWLNIFSIFLVFVLVYNLVPIVFGS